MPAKPALVRQDYLVIFSNWFQSLALAYSVHPYFAKLSDSVASVIHAGVAVGSAINRVAIFHLRGHWNAGRLLLLLLSVGL